MNHVWLWLTVWANSLSDQQLCKQVQMFDFHFTKTWQEVPFLSAIFNQVSVNGTWQDVAELKWQSRCVYCHYYIYVLLRTYSRTLWGKLQTHCEGLRGVNVSIILTRHFSSVANKSTLAVHPDSVSFPGATVTLRWHHRLGTWSSCEGLWLLK